MAKLELALLVGEETKTFLANLTKQIDRLEKLGEKTVPEEIAQAEAAVDEDEEDLVPKKSAKKAPAKKPVSFDDDEPAEPEADVEEDDDSYAAKFKPKKAKKVTLDDVNDACKALALHIGKTGRQHVLGILKKKFKTETVSGLEPEQYAACVEAMVIPE